jgi:hypothetical protein
MSDEFVSGERAFGRLEGRVSAIERELRDDREANKKFFDEMRTDLADIKKTLHESALADANRTGLVKGGWAVAVAVATSLIAIGGLAITGLKSLFNIH